MTEPEFKPKQCMSQESMPRNLCKKKKSFKITAFVRWYKLCALWPPVLVSLDEQLDGQMDYFYLVYTIR